MPLLFKERELASQDRRLRILQLLNNASQMTANDAVLAAQLAELWGHKVARDILLNDLMWLGQIGLINIHVKKVVWAATLLQSGQDAALGKYQVHGIARP